MRPALKLNVIEALEEFQYRKRYEVTCDVKNISIAIGNDKFQYRKRYEVTCDMIILACIHFRGQVSIPQAV